MKRDRFDVDAVVIGAGPAGALAARGLARRGRAVLLVDRREGVRHKVCGCCLNTNALTTLDAAGLGSLCEQLHAHPLKRFRMLADKRRADVPLVGGVALSRDAFDHALIRKARESGADFHEGVTARVEPGEQYGQSRRRVSLSNGETIQAGVVIVADGLGGTSLSRLPEYRVEARPASRIGIGGVVPMPQGIGLSHHVPEGYIVMACGRAGYLGAVRLEDGSIDLAAAVNRDAMKAAGSPGELLQSLADEAGFDASGLADVRWTLTPGLTRHRARLAGPRLFITGDAAGYVEPFTGEGMAWALAGGAAVAEVADRAIESDDASLSTQWQDTHATIVGRRQLACRVVARTLRSPRLTSAAVYALSVAPLLGHAVSKRLGRPTITSPRTPPLETTPA